MISTHSHSHSYSHSHTYTQDVPYMGAYLMDKFVPRERKHAMMVMTKAYALFNFILYFTVVLLLCFMLMIIENQYIVYLQSYYILSAYAIPYTHSLSSFRPTLPVSYITKQLGFEDADMCMSFLVSVNAVFTPSNQDIDCKLTFAALSDSQ